MDGLIIIAVLFTATTCQNVYCEKCLQDQYNQQGDVSNIWPAHSNRILKRAKISKNSSVTVRWLCTRGFKRCMQFKDEYKEEALCVKVLDEMFSIYSFYLSCYFRYATVFVC